MIFSFEASVVMQRIKNLNTLKGMDNQAIDVWIFRGGRWEASRSTELVPGDLFSLSRAGPQADVVPCDCLLLRGSAVVNEATLTGESIPQMKDCIPTASDEVREPLSFAKPCLFWAGVHMHGVPCHAVPCQVLDLKTGTGKVHVLFGGTRVMQITPGKQGAEQADAHEGARWVWVTERVVSVSRGGGGRQRQQRRCP
jgi:cation-transporting ATPase 13A1